MNKQKILGMVAAAKLQLDELEFNPREFLSKLESELNSNTTFEYPAESEGAPEIRFVQGSC
jgi:hypothetical protein